MWLSYELMTSFVFQEYAIWTQNDGEGVCRHMQIVVC
jgi:hypothetical protein